MYLDEATQEQTNSSLSINDIIEDTQSMQDGNDRGMLVLALALIQLNLVFMI
jgi:hypothetical protein